MYLLPYQIRSLKETKPEEVTNDMYSLACGPEAKVNLYSGCVVDGIRFVTEDEDKDRISQNSGVFCVKEIKGEKVELYGVITSVWEVNFPHGQRVVLFKCKWFRPDKEFSSAQHDCNLLRLDPKRTWHEYFPYLLATEAQLAFFPRFDDFHMYAQKLEHRLFWDVLDSSGIGEEDEVAVAKPEACSFEWTKHVGEIQRGGLLSSSHLYQVITDNILPNLHGECVGDQNHVFEDLSIQESFNDDSDDDGEF